ncbi:hypothetical protein [Streptomyces sp. NPDC048275]|uniref:hypothetical protein n=1 Tax=Bacillati TaxID=1783272 RepID=UPI0033E7132B
MEKLCVYCYSLNLNSEENIKCSTCGAPLNPERNMEKIKTRNPRLEKYDDTDLNKLFLPYDELVKYSFVQLYRLLKLARIKKEETYQKKEFDEYSTLKTQSLLIENLLFDKGGYVPKAIQESDISHLEYEHRRYLNRHEIRIKEALENK